jgi:hypothetical protein
MKQLFFSIILAFTTINCLAQTNTFPTTGNVGIGTTSPAAKLDIGGFITTPALSSPVAVMSSNGNNITGLELQNTNTGIGADARIVLSDPTGAYFAFAMPGTGNTSANLFGKTRSTTAFLFTSAARDMAFGTAGAKTLTLGTSNAARMTILSTGEIGIGTATPAAKLDVFTTSENLRLSYDATHYASFNTSSLGSVAITRNASPLATEGLEIFGSNGEVSITSNNSTNAALYVKSNGAGNVVSFLDGANTAFTILDGGNVGIGTATPTEALSVNGKIRSKEVKVETANWPDYVFKPSYQLTPLSEVKLYIDKNQHLPEMPSEQEIAKNGQNLGEINKLLVKKIEELTLYLITLENRVKELEKKDK